MESVIVRELINFYFNGGDEELIGTTKCGAICIKSQEKYKSSFNETSLCSQSITR